MCHHANLFQLIERAIRIKWTELCAEARTDEDEERTQNSTPEFSLIACHIAFREIQQRVNDISMFSLTWSECIQKIDDFLEKEKGHALTTLEEMVRTFLLIWTSIIYIAGK